MVKQPKNLEPNCPSPPPIKYILVCSERRSNVAGVVSLFFDKKKTKNQKQNKTDHRLKSSLSGESSPNSHRFHRAGEARRDRARARSAVPVAAVAVRGRRRSDHNVRRPFGSVRHVAATSVPQRRPGRRVARRPVAGRATLGGRGRPGERRRRPAGRRVTTASAALARSCGHDDAG